MAFTLVSYNESVDPAAAWVNLTATPDPHVTVSGDDILVPELDQLLATAACVDQTVASQVRVTTPSLLAGGFQEYLSQLASGLVFGIQPEVNSKSSTPIQLDRLEAMQVQVLTNPSSAAQHYVGVWLGDGALSPITTGEIRTVRCTASVSIVVTGWTNGALTFPVSLKAGQYQVVGMRCQSANSVFARLVFPGQAWRPGAPCVNDEVDRDYPLFRGGNAGVWGTFDSASPPTIDILGTTDSSEEIFLDLQYLG